MMICVLVSMWLVECDLSVGQKYLCDFLSLIDRLNLRWLFDYYSSEWIVYGTELYELINDEIIFIKVTVVIIEEIVEEIYSISRELYKMLV